MKTSIAVLFLILAVALLYPDVAAAQNVGLRVAIGPQFGGPQFAAPHSVGSHFAGQHVVPVINPSIVVPGFHQPIVMPFITSPVSGFPATQAPFVVRQGVVTTQGICCVPAHFGGTSTIVPFVPGATIVTQHVIVPPTVLIQTPGPRAHAGPHHARNLPPIGTSRDQVISALGEPAVTVVTRTGETLHFGGGITVFIQNGHVASPR